MSTRPRRATTLETTGARLEKLVHARLGAREPALVELLACVDNAIARARMTPPGGPQPAIAAVPLAVFDALVAARDAIEDAPKPGADHG